MEPSSEIKVALSGDQALVLYEWVARHDDKDALPFEHRAERNVLWAIEGQLDA